MKNTVYPKVNLSTALVLRAECRVYPTSSNDLCHLHLSLSLLASIRQAEMCSNVNNCLYPSFLHASTIMLQTSKHQKKKSLFLVLLLTQVTFQWQRNVYPDIHLL